MIRINLLAVERKAVMPTGAAFQPGLKFTIACSSILIVAALLVGWRYRTLEQNSALLDKQIADAQQETVRLRAVLQQVQQFEQQRAQLQQRVMLIEQLQTSQTGPVHMLDQISRSLPPMVWLTELKQTDETVLIDGKCTALTRLSDFISTLESSGYFKRSIEIVSSQSEALSVPSGELIKFTIKAQFQQAAETAPKK